MLIENVHKRLVTTIRTWSETVTPPWKKGHETGWLSELQGAGEELEGLGTTTESEFLGLGEKLQDFYHRSAEFSRLSTSVAHLMSGEEIGTAIEGFRNVIGRTRNLEGASRQNVETLQRLIKILKEMGRSLSGFNKIVRGLRVLCVFTRMESANLGAEDNGFNVLADAVAKLALEIEEKYSQLLSQTESLSQHIGETLFKVSELEAKQQLQASVIIDKTLASLESLTQKHTSSSASVTRIAARYEAISRSIGEIVSSMQFHDITRQRIEHASQALVSLTQGEPAAEKPNGEREKEKTRTDSKRDQAKPRGLIDRARRIREHAGKSRERLHLAGRISQLQIAQLRNAGEGLVGAVENIIRHLKGVADLIAEISQETQQMAGAADETGRSFLSELEAGSTSIGSAFSAFAEVDRELSSIMGSVGTTLRDMATFAGAIEGIGQRIKMLALNAIVKASHVGDEGRTLGVLAENIHTLSIDTCRRTLSVGEALRSMTSEADALCANASTEEGTTCIEVTGMQEVLSSLLADLRRVNGSIVALLTRMNDEGRLLSEDILRTLKTIEVHRRVEAVLNGVISRLEGVTALARSFDRTDGDSKGTEPFQTLEASYTMQEERDVHHSLLGSADAFEKLGSEPSGFGTENQTHLEDQSSNAKDQAEEDLGDNVELF